MIDCPHHVHVDLGTDDGMRHAMLVYGPQLRAFAARRVGSWGSAEDVVQETMLRAWRSAHRFDPERGSLRAWLFSILRNLLIDLVRARARRPCTTSAEAESAAPDDTEHILGSLTIGPVLRKLSAEHRQVIDHCYLQQRPHSEVAQLLGVPVGTIRSRLFYAREAMRNALDAIEVTDNASASATQRAA
jgi:RNA polymerase sigma-70 factor (ECF subfamily)